jgi:hypothetical protein
MTLHLSSTYIELRLKVPHSQKDLLPNPAGLRCEKWFIGLKKKRRHTFNSVTWQDSASFCDTTNSVVCFHGPAWVDSTDASAIVSHA